MGGMCEVGTSEGCTVPDYVASVDKSGSQNASHEASNFRCCGCNRAVCVGIET